MKSTLGESQPRSTHVVIVSKSKSFSGVLVSPGSMRKEYSNQESNYYSMTPYTENIYSGQPEFGHLNVQQLHELAQQQQQQISYQYEVLAQKRQQLNYLHYWREYKHRMAYEYGRLLHLKAKVAHSTLMYNSLMYNDSHFLCYKRVFQWGGSVYVICSSPPLPLNFKNFSWWVPNKGRHY